MTVQDVLSAVEQLAPPHYAFGFDKVGLQAGDPAAEVTRVAVSLDSGMGAIQFAAESGAEVLVAHHPLIWEPLKAVRSDDWNQRRIFEAIRYGVAIIAAHTNWDCAPGGVNDALATKLGLQDVHPFGLAAEEARWKLAVFAPIESQNALIDALSAAGAGVIGNYERCAFWVNGTGTFNGLEGANPVVGKAGQVENVSESRIEMVVPNHRKRAVEEALRAAHPYEEPAFDWIRLECGHAYPAGRIGNLGQVEDFQREIDSRLGCRSEMWVGHDHPIRRVAVFGGAAASEWQAAVSAGADAFITGEVPQHVGLEASESGLTILACGHYSTEQPGMEALACQLQANLQVPTLLYEPVAGQSGRPC